VRLYRVFPYLPAARTGEPGHPLYVPSPQGAGRIDNPDLYEAIYLGNGAVCAVAETFGNLKTWTPKMFLAPYLPGSRRAIGTYELPDAAAVADLDDPSVLVTLGLRPSRVSTRRRPVTQAWARTLFEQHQWIGVRWWSYHDPDWYAYGLWDRTKLRVVQVDPLAIGNQAIIDAANLLRRIRRER